MIDGPDSEPQPPSLPKISPRKLHCVSVPYCVKSYSARSLSTARSVHTIRFGPRYPISFLSGDLMIWEIRSAIIQVSRILCKRYAVGLTREGLPGY
ncbi:hypothetical protein GGTG_05199 [Gaeumannomyces tritici R3-111a-1]|uniref:Uncharacterized protein n=1 Tax=Gaeumannomyces tritici (strain R3-111a-1) TaxID=644352 RepID=J3NV86_GAET3|nr:hypothetical protein GGTG_05199 [Gaeumannomyces tritici R3-111a-1]EJT75262.1 hypothetical protein GGTG_05199 [Gaeumannomyces tritici R3-111a-1]